MPVDIKNKIIAKHRNEKEERLDTGFNFTKPKYSIEDIVLPKKTANVLKDYIYFIQVQDKIFDQWGLSKTHRFEKRLSVNLYGAPGTGKTMGAHVIANELNLPLISVNYAEIESKYVGETAKNITKLFQIAKENNAILFFDEADALLSKRVTNMSSSTDVSVNQTRSVLLSLMNDHDGIIIFTTNFIENYDSAFMRRILSHIEFTLPDDYERALLWKKYIPNELPVEGFDLINLVNKSSGLSGSEISNCVLKTAIKSARNNNQVIKMNLFYESIDEIVKSKQANDPNTIINTKIVSEDHVVNQIGIEATTELKAL